ncbi:hypothetical protein L1S35_02420 [Flavobacterium sp. AS60]|uniref:hypothetical protein n=1 Tax=Flavobacterium anseongense TaxID=2910677 RepID=UPI001F209C38|nr:hypothetical protein [Flavobacterium sp. AS60]MCF6128510.1 hypothetical protein [Flavobacterium sp. AS60]
MEDRKFLFPKVPVTIVIFLKKLYPSMVLLSTAINAIAVANEPNNITCDFIFSMSSKLLIAKCLTSKKNRK